MTVRDLSKPEFDRLMSECDERDTQFFRSMPDPYERIHRDACEVTGAVIGDRPVYFLALLPYKDSYQFCSAVVSDGVKEPIAMFRQGKRFVAMCRKKYSNVFASMEKDEVKCVEWTKRLGFDEIGEDNGLVMLTLRR